MIRRKFAKFFLLIVPFLSILFDACINTPKDTYLNHNDTVKYVGKQACGACHEDNYHSFLHTGMGKSFNNATPEHSAAIFNHQAIFDTFNKMYYLPFWKGNSLFIKELKLLNSDTIHSFSEKIDFIIGSGQHTNSHLILRNGYVVQAPFTWYAQQKIWNLPPGFEGKNNKRFSRVIDVECMSCHNSMPVVAPLSTNKFISIGQGIDCERCHGPGELHVQMRSNGKTNNVKNGIDYTIVNPSKLSWQLQVDVCQRCHLQGNAVLKEGKTFTDFKPGMKLSDFMEVYMPKYKYESEDFIMASHAQRLQQSKCFINSNTKTNQLKLTCITCHNPHISVSKTKVDIFNAACTKCHSNNNSKTCKIASSKNNNCVSCHMPQKGSDDIPHVSVHDHKIAIHKAIDKKTKAKILEGLYCINNPKPETKMLIKAYLSYYEKFDQNIFYLQKADELLQKDDDNELRIHYNYLLKKYKEIANKYLKYKNHSFYDNWSYYRIGQSLLNLNKSEEAIPYLNKAIEKMPFEFEIQYRLAVAYQNLKWTNKAIDQLMAVITLYPYHTAALNDLGVLYMQQNNSSMALNWFKKSEKTDPFYEAVINNLLQYYQLENNTKMFTRYQKKLEEIRNRH